MADERITVTLPGDLLYEMDRLDSNRSRFVREAIRHSLEYRRQQSLAESLAEPHADLRELESLGFGDWAGEGAEEDLADPRAGTPIRWEEGRGWVEGEE
jgi:Arc/MetJ-type ribon-helix-helix transcriptional regulator